MKSVLMRYDTSELLNYITNHEKKESKRSRFIVFNTRNSRKSNVKFTLMTIQKVKCMRHFKPGANHVKEKLLFRKE